jgi:hypothetical protein
MVVGNSELTTMKHVGELLVISIAMQMGWYGAHPGLHLKPLDAAIGRVPAPYCPGSRHGQQI